MSKRNVPVTDTGKNSPTQQTRAVNMSDFADKDSRPVDGLVPTPMNPNDVLNLREGDFESADSPLVKEAKANARPSYQDLVKQTNFYKTGENVTPPQDLDEQMTKTGDISEVPDDYSSSLDPITEGVINQSQNSLDSIKIGSYTQNGELFVFVDTKTIDRGNSYEVKQAAYEYRFNINMPNSGIEEWGAPFVISKNANPRSKFFDEGYTGTVYRKTFKLRATLR